MTLVVVEGPAVLDEVASEDFLAAALAKVDAPALDELAEGVWRKHERVRTLLDDLRAGEPRSLSALLGLVFSCRRHQAELLGTVGEEALAAGLLDLVDGDGSLPERIDRTVDLLAPAGPIGFDLPGEVLHFADPTRFWLWTRWMWDPERETGALALVAAEPPDPDLGRSGEAYLAVGSLVGAVASWLGDRGVALGSPACPPSVTVDVLLACVYAVYLGTVLRLRMTQEFNRLVPPMPDLVSRLLGVRYLEG